MAILARVEIESYLFSCKILNFVLFNSDKYLLAKSPVFRLLETTPRLAERPRLRHQLLQQHVKGNLFITLLRWIQGLSSYLLL